MIRGRAVVAVSILLAFAAAPAELRRAFAGTGDEPARGQEKTEGKDDQELVTYKGRKVTLEEKRALEQGLVKYKDRWVTPEEKKNLEKGLVFHRGRWMSAKDKEQFDKGLLPHKGKWLPREKVEEIRSNWDDAWEISGPHFFVRTNGGEELASDVLTILEAAYPEYKMFFAGAEPPRSGSKKNKTRYDVDVPQDLLPIFLFKSKAEYEAHCRDHNAPEQVESPGYFDSATEVYVTYAGELGRHQLLVTTVGAVSEMYCWYAWDDRMPEWFAEGAKRYFEGLKWDGSRLTIGEPYTALVQAMREGEKIPLKRLLRVTLASVANTSERWVWGGQCWALVKFFQAEEGAAFRKSWDTLCARYRAKVNFTDMKGAANTNEAGAKIFEEVFGKDLAPLEKALSDFLAKVPER